MDCEREPIYLPKKIRRKRFGEFFRCDNLNCADRSGGVGQGSCGVICEPPTFLWKGQIRGIAVGDVLSIEIALCCQCRTLVDEQGNFEVYLV